MRQWNTVEHGPVRALRDAIEGDVMVSASGQRVAMVYRSPDDGLWHTEDALTNVRAHRVGGPAAFVVDYGVFSEEWYRCGLCSREDGPSGPDGDWYLHGALHRIEGPAWRGAWCHNSRDWRLRVRHEWRLEGCQVWARDWRRRSRRLRWLTM